MRRGRTVRRAIAALALVVASALIAASVGVALAPPAGAAVVGPTVTVNQAVGQVDPTTGAAIGFRAVFSVPVTGFTASDVVVAGTAPSNKFVTITPVAGSPTAYDISIGGMFSSGTVTASIPAGAVVENNSASTSTDNVVSYVRTVPTLTINQPASQRDPRTVSPVQFDAAFSQAVGGFTGSDVVVSGTAPGTLRVNVSAKFGSSSVYTVSIEGMTGPGTVVVTVPANVVIGGNAASTSTDNSVTYLPDQAFVAINQAAGQVDPTTASPIRFTVVFSEAVDGFTGTDVAITGTAPGNKSVAVSPVSGVANTFTVAVSGMTGSGSVIATIPAGAATDRTGAHLTQASTSTDNAVNYAPPVTVTVNQGAGQADPTTAAPVRFRAVFSRAVGGFDANDVVITGTAPGIKSVTVTPVAGSTGTYDLAVSGMTGPGTVIATIPAGRVLETNAQSASTDNTITYSPVVATVTVNQMAGQADPTNRSPINFTVVFGSAVTGFGPTDVLLGGTAPGTKTVVVSGGPSTYTVAVSGMTGSGTVVASVPANVVGGGNLASTSTDNNVVYDTIAPRVTVNQATTQADPAVTPTITFTAAFSEPVTGFTGSDVAFAGTAPGSKTATVTGGPTTYTVTVTGMAASGTVIASIPAGVVTDLAGNANAASTSTDNSVQVDLRTVTIDRAADQADPTNASPIRFTVVFSVPVTGFTSSDVTIGGTTPGTKAGVVTGGPTTYTVAVSGMTGSGTVSASIPANVVSGGNLTSTSTDNFRGLRHRGADGHDQPKRRPARPISDVADHLHRRLQ